MVEIFENTEEQIKSLTKFGIEKMATLPVSAREVKIKDNSQASKQQSDVCLPRGVMKKVVNANSEGIAEPSL